MSDEYARRYEGLSHQQLYDQLQAGDPAQIDGLAAKWSSAASTCDSLTSTLRTDLDRLAPTWTGSAAEEFNRRLSLVVSYSENLGGEFRAVKDGLAAMSTPLRAAQRDAESPDETDDHDKAAKGAVIGGLLAGPGGALVGGLVGHGKDKEEQERAHQRMVQVVAGLAAQYELSQTRNWPTQPLSPPADLPGGGPASSSSPRSGPGAGTPGQVDATGPGATTGGVSTSTGGVSTSTSVWASEDPSTGVATGAALLGAGAVAATGPGPRPGSGQSGEPEPGNGTSLAGAAGAGALVTGWTAGAGGLVAASAGAGRVGGAGLNVDPRTGTPAGGVLGTGSLAAAPGGARPKGAGAGGSQTGRAAHTGRGVRDARGRGDGSARQAGSGGPQSAMAGGARGAGTGDDDNDERTTWLTEDEMVWQGREQAPPTVLGSPD